jgi:transcriptional regulator GlxA family with amidase domain
MGDRAVNVVSISDTGEPLTCAHGLKVTPDLSWADEPHFEILVLPGGNSGSQLDREDIRSRLRRLADSGAVLTSVCTGALVLADAGLLDGKPATTHWSALEDLANIGVGIEVRRDARFVDTGVVITAAGVSAGIDMALHLVARFDGHEVAKAVRRYIQYDPAPPV